jgi:PAS domain S-box-containing protein
MATEETREELKGRIKELEKAVAERDKELEETSLELALGISEVLEGLKEIASGNPEVRISETSGLESMAKLKSMVNVAGRNLAEIVNLSHEFAMGLAEHFDVLNRVSKGDLVARVAGLSDVELLESLKKVTNHMIESVSAEIMERKEAQQALQEAHQELEKRVEERTRELAKTNKQLRREIQEREKTEAELRESETKYSTLVEDSQTGIYIDQDEKIVFANETFAQMYKYSKEELQGMESWKLAHPDDREFTNEMRARRLSGDPVPVDYEAKGLTKDGETIWIRRKNTRIEYEGKPAILGNIVDISAQMRVEKELRKRNEELNNFVHVVSHDLKTPIIAIQGFSSRLSQHAKDRLGAKGTIYLEQIETSARRMEGLVSDLLALSKLGQVSCNFQSVPASEIIRNVTSALKPRFKEKGIRLVAGDNFPMIYCDAERMHQVFENLAVNAIKYLGETADPTIEIGFEDTGEAHRFFIRDNGVGIDPAFHRKIFEMFERLKEAEDAEGTGLGLAIVEKIVESHGGKVWVESQKGAGATFYFTLPKRSP